MNNDEMINTKHSSLETSTDVKDTLGWKIESLKSDNLPTDTGMADYIAFSMQNLEGQLNQFESVKKEIADREKSIKAQIEAIKVDGAAFLLDNGIEKIDGAICSSVSVTKAKEEKTEIIEEKEVKLLVSEEEVEELLLGMGMAETVTVKKEKVTKAQPAKLKVNKRRVITPEIDE
jgi:hypothetical protein